MSVAAEEGEFEPPRSNLSGRWTRCRLVEPADYQFLYNLLVRPANAHRWRFRGVTPEPHMFEQLLWSGVLAQFVVEELKTGRPLGLVAAFDAAPDLSHVAIGVIFEEDVRGRQWPAESILLFLGYLFDHWPLRKLYAHVPEYNMGPLRGTLRRGMSVEGRLSDHVYFDGRYWDEFILALRREDFFSRSRLRNLAR